MATMFLMAFPQSSFKESAESHKNISCYLVSKQKLFCTLFIVPLHWCLSARFTTRPITQLQQH